MDIWVFWLILAAGLVAAEIFSGDLVLIMLAGGALASGILAAAGLNFVGQCLVFVIASVGLLAGVRPLAKRHFLIKNPLVSGTDGLVGREAVVVETVDANGGRIKLAGNIWSARPHDRREVLSEGLTVRVARIEGATAIVWYASPP